MVRSSRRRALVALLVAAAAAAGLAAAPGADAALVVDPTVVAGTPLPPNPDVPPTGVTVDQVSTSYAVWTAGQPDEFAPVQPVIHNLVNGGAVRPLPAGGTLNGASVVVPVSTGFEIRDVAGGTVTATVTVPGTDRVVAATEKGVVTVRAAALHLLRPDGTDVLVTGPVPPDLPGAVPAFDERTVVYQVGTALWALDLTAATTTRLTDAAPALPVVRLGGSVVWWIDDSGVGPHATAFWNGRSGGTIRSVTVAQDGLLRAWEALGNGLVIGRLNPVTSLLDYFVVDPLSGAANFAFAASVVNARGNSGRVVAMTGATAPGQVLVDAGSVPRVLTPLPPIGRATGVVKRSGTRTVGAFAYPLATQRAATLTSGGTSWTPGVDGTVVAGRPVDAAGDVVLSWDSNPADVRTRIWHLTWPGGHRDVVADSVRLGGRGLLVAVGSDPVVVQDTRTGAVRRTVPAASGALALDGPLVWLLRSAAAQLVVADTTGAQADRVVTAPCAADTGGLARLVVAGRWGVVSCPTLAAWLVDLTGPAPAFRLADGEGTNAVVGNGFVVTRRQLVETGTARGYTVLAVRSANPAHAEVLYGPLASAGGFGADDAGGFTLVYSDTAQQPRSVSLRADLPGPAHPDVTAPVLVSTGGSPAVAPTTTVSFTWQFRDTPGGSVPASGLRSSDVRYRQKPAGATTYGAFVTPPALQASTASSTTLVAARGTDTCWSVRARDGANNLSAWSAERCTKVDGTAPTVTSAGAGSRVAATVAAKTVRFSYAATDDIAVSGYDVGLRTAAAGAALGPWTAPPSWQRTTATSRTRSVAPGEDACFRVRARDAAGNVSSYSAMTCVTVPLDDRALTAGAGTTTLADTRALGSTVTRLDRSGASVTLAGQTGRRVAVVVLEGPGQGSVQVLVGGASAGSVSLAAPAWKRVTVYLPAKTFTGAVEVRSTSSAPARVDALAVLRG